MQPYLKRIKTITIAFLIVVIPIFLCAEEATPKGNRGVIESNPSPEIKKSEKTSKPESQKQQEELTQLQLEARAYRDQGLQYQRAGNLDAALTYYQKAIELDPMYAVAYNDLGIVYDAQGQMDRAEESYLKAIKIDPAYLSACTNLALLYEGKRDFTKAAFYWEKRVALGSSDDPWTEKARRRLEDIRMVSAKTTLKDAREQEVVDLLNDVVNKKAILKKDDLALAKEHFKKAKKSYDRQDYPTAIKEALDAQQLDPGNKEIESFIDKARLRALSK